MFKKTLACLVLAGCMLVSIDICWAGSQRDAVCQGSCGGGCGPCPGSSSSGSSGGYDNSSYDYEAARRAQEQAEAARRAEAEHQAELERQHREAENKRLMEEAARQAEFIKDRDAAAGTLRGSTGTRAASGGFGEPVLRGSSADTGLRGLKSGNTTTPNLDPMVVDARNVPSGLPKAVDNAIAAAYLGAPVGVTDRVRKGFQAVMNQDWEVAKAWFQDALNRDPNNAGLKRLVDLAGYKVQKGEMLPPPTTKRKPNAADKVRIEATMAALDRIGDEWLEKEMAESLIDYSRGGSRKPLAKNQVQLPVDSDIELHPDFPPAKASVSNKKGEIHN